MESETAELLSKYSELINKLSKSQFDEWNIHTQCPKSHLLKKADIEKLLKNKLEIDVIKPGSYKVTKLKHSSTEVKNMPLFINGYIIVHDNFKKWLSKHIEKIQSTLLFQNVVENDDVRGLVAKKMSDETFKSFAITNSTVRDKTMAEYAKRRFDHYRKRDIAANLPICITYIKLGDYDNFIKNYSANDKDQIGVYAIACNRVNVLEFLFTKATKISGYDMEYEAVKRGHLHMLEIIKKNINKLQYNRWHSKLLEVAFDNKKFNAFIWLAENTDIIPTVSVIEILSEKGHLELMKKLQDTCNNYGKHGVLFCASAALGGRLDVLEWLHTVKKCAWNDEVYINAIKNNHDNIVKYAFENKCPVKRARLLVRIANNSSNSTIKELVNRYVRLPAFTYISVFHNLNDSFDSSNSSQSSRNSSQSSSNSSQSSRNSSQSSRNSSQSSRNSDHHNTRTYVTKEMNKINGKFRYINEGDIVHTYCSESDPLESVYCVRIINGGKKLDYVMPGDTGMYGYEPEEYIAYAEGEFPTTDFSQVTFDLGEYFHF